MTLIDAIEQAQASNEKKLASQVPTPKQGLDSEALLLLRHFAEWAKQRGVKFLPCAPTSAAAFIRTESAVGVPADRIIRTLEAIQTMHDNAGLANPIATAPVRTELVRILKIDGPRSWSKAERLVFTSLAPEVQAIIQRHAKIDSDAVRKAQNQAAAFKQQLESLEKGNIENGTPEQKTNQ
jgi:hypothetical protein